VTAVAEACFLPETRQRGAKSLPLRAGLVSNEIVHEDDTFTTFARIAGAQLPQDCPIDGVDQKRLPIRERQPLWRRGSIVNRQLVPGAGPARARTGEDARLRPDRGLVVQ